jgi:hypothetical protein
MGYSYRTFAVLASVVIVTLSGGCGDGRVEVSGQLLDNGRPYTFDNEDIQVFFEPIGPTPDTGDAKKDGATGDKSGADADPPEETPKPVAASVGPWKHTFRAVSNDLKGVVPGTYRVSVLSTPYQSGGNVSRDKFNGKYFGASSPFKLDVRGRHVEVVIDVGTGTIVTK